MVFSTVSWIFTVVYMTSVLGADPVPAPRFNCDDLPEKYWCFNEISASLCEALELCQLFWQRQGQPLPELHNITVGNTPVLQQMVSGYLGKPEPEIPNLDPMEFRTTKVPLCGNAGEEEQCRNLITASFCNAMEKCHIFWRKNGNPQLEVQQYGTIRRAPLEPVTISPIHKLALSLGRISRNSSDPFFSD